MSTQAKPFLTPEQYLEIERKAEFKSEYCNGEMFAMAGASLAHVRLVGNLFASLRQQLKEQPCDVLMNDMRVLVSPTGLYTYPDVIVVSGEPKLTDTHLDTLLNPTLIVEVLSPSTEAYDRGRKFEHYQSIESLQQYLLVASDRMHVDLYTRQPVGGWLRTSASGPGECIELTSIGCRITLADLHWKVDVTAPRR